MKKTDVKIAVEKPNAGAGFASEFSHLAEWLADPRTDELFGPAWRVKFRALAEIVTNDRHTVAADIAREFGVDRKSIAVHVRACRRIFGIPAPPAKKLRRS